MKYLTGASEFLVGCNYWSSESAINMWHNWSEEAVEKDFAALKEAGMNTVRIFPLWSDFQPVSWAFMSGKSSGDRDHALSAVRWRRDLHFHQLRRL